MKKILCIAIITALFILLISCADKTNIEASSNSHVEFWTDTETGVQYVIYDKKDGYGGMGGITPRLNSDGTLYKN